MASTPLSQRLRSANDSAQPTTPLRGRLCVFDAEIRNDRIWLHHDGLNHGITEDWLAASVSKEQIILAFRPLHSRQHTGLRGCLDKAAHTRHPSF
ncbi:element excision factor XisI family protein [Leptolyngbya sp. Heron Island J]|uniref:element excision factor XisI family protein n=1 Tax=Leptolyngbya sp. Heron Island J TaxID=1385935 RepID=UPI0008FEE8B8|nr:element excision factor XisI family protein [Leptolyngbya sp. Heron Island J]